jgi:hypothetical protein
VSPDVVGLSHPDFAVLTVSWELALRVDGYAENTVRADQDDGLCRIQIPCR